MSDNSFEYTGEIKSPSTVHDFLLDYLNARVREKEGHTLHERTTFPVPDSEVIKMRRLRQGHGKQRL